MQMKQEERKSSLNFFNRQDPTKPSPRLELFIDINYTIMVTSSRERTDRKTGVLSLLAECYSAIWDKSITQEEMTFKAFVTKHLHPGREDLQIEQYTNFISYLENNGHHDMLREVVKENEEMIKIFEQNEKEDDIFPSFIKLIEHLEENKHQTPYTIILRTFGHDLKRTVAELERRTQIKFGSYAEFNRDGHLIIDGEIKKSALEIRSVIQPSVHGAWQDNYDRWKAHQFVTGGKIFPLDIQNDEVISIFWDDNIGQKDKKIITVELASGETITNHEQLEDQLITMKHLVSVKAREAIKDKDYFIKLKNYAYDRSATEVQHLIDHTNTTSEDPVDRPAVRI